MSFARLLATALLCTAIQASAHDDLLGTRYVAATGVDEGECAHAHVPCRTIDYAIANGIPGGTVKVAEGLYSIEGLDIEEVLHGKTGVMGGFRVADGFKYQDLDASATSVYGASLFSRDRLRARGLNLIVDEVAIRRALAEADAGNPLGYRATSLPSQAPAECTQGRAGQFPCFDVDFAGRLSLSQFSSNPGSMSNLWGFVDRNDHREYAVVGLRNGTAVVDVTDPQAPREVGTVPGLSSIWREVKVYQFFDAAANRHRAYAYVTTEALQGLHVIDLSNLPTSVSLANTITTFQSAHTLYVSNVDYATNAALPGREAFLYVAGSNRNTGSNQGSFLIFDLDDPAAPRLVTDAPVGTGYMHDSTSLYITDNRTAQCDQGHNPCEILVDFNETSVDLWDVTNKSLPVRLSATGYATARYTHSGWPTPDQRRIIVHDELDELRIPNLNTQIYSLRIDDLRAPTVAVAAIGPNSTTDHNGYAVGDRYYVAHYRRGLVIFDLSDPTGNLREVGSLDTFLSPAEDVAGTDGAWGVYPFLPSGTVLISDIDNGLFVVRDVRNLQASPGRLGFAGTIQSASEGAVQVQVPVRRSRGVVGPVSITYATRDGTATAGSDYAAASGTLTWPAGNNDDRGIIVTLSADFQPESDETLTITLSSPTGGAVIDGSSEITLTVRNDDGNGGGNGGGGGGGALSWSLLSLLAALWMRHARVRVR